MKNLKLLIAFLAGVAVTLLLAIKPWHIFLPHLTWNIDDGVGGTLAVIALILVGAYLSQRSSERSPAKFFEFLQKLRTSETDCWLGGVCGGLGRSTPVPSWVWRLCFAVAFLFYGSGLFAYFLLWIFMPDEIAHTQTTSNPTSASFFEFLRQLRLSSRDFWFGGVCGGLAESTQIPSWVWRLGFVLLTLYFGCGLLIYLLLWICLPSGETKNHSAA